MICLQHAELISHKSQIEHLELLIAKLRRMQFGRSSEKVEADGRAASAASWKPELGSVGFELFELDPTQQAPPVAPVQARAADRTARTETGQGDLAGHGVSSAPSSSTRSNRIVTGRSN
jgi:hypothetical protein